MRDDGLLRTEGAHAPATVERRLSSWSTLHRWKGLEGPFASPALRSALRLAVRASARPRRRKSRRALTRDVLDRLLATCATDRLVDARDLAVLIVAFASGGRRRSEVAGLRLEQLQDESPVPLDPADPNSTPLPRLAIHLGRTKTTSSRHRERTGFRSIDRWGARQRAGAHAAVDQPARQAPMPGAGLDPSEFSAHGLRSGRKARRCRRRCSSPSTSRSSRRRATTTKWNRRAARRPTSARSLTETFSRAGQLDSYQLPHSAVPGRKSPLPDNLESVDHWLNRPIGPISLVGGPNDQELSRMPILASLPSNPSERIVRRKS